MLDVGAVRFDGSYRDRQFGGDLGVGVSEGKAAENFDFSWGEPRGRWTEFGSGSGGGLSQQCRSQRWVDVSFAGGDGAHGEDEFDVGRFLDDVPARAGIEGLAEVGDVVVHGEDEYSGVGADAEDSGDGGKAAFSGKPEVDNEDVGCFCFGDRHRFVCGAGFSDHIDVRFVDEEALQSCAEEGVVVTERDS